MTSFLKKQFGSRWKGREIVHQDYHEIIFAMTERPGMADFLATLRAGVQRMFNVNVTTD